jgi:hypothetical protein
MLGKTRIKKEVMVPEFLDDTSGTYLMFTGGA